MNRERADFRSTPENIDCIIAEAVAMRNAYIAELVGRGARRLTSAFRRLATLEVGHSKKTASA
ncbi:hypothetical protein J2T57_002188 [Natronocella acetinitrilica]|uniref:Uncharacterized protein n=1 Tax=Natronocella acetinitrilica TaxID=414046 RepID=A0AAE3G3B8_9GAMM|nr:hypothetical protein [Natronocella acetinitrilica]MCP1675040.1 hypothetical protein [Natronocella acetinitrilica]